MSEFHCTWIDICRVNCPVSINAIGLSKRFPVFTRHGLAHQYGKLAWMQVRYFAICVCLAVYVVVVRRKILSPSTNLSEHFNREGASTQT